MVFSLATSLVTFYIMIGVAIVQPQMLQECKTVTNTTFPEMTLEFTKCRYKDNYFDEQYGPYENGSVRIVE